jgi:hypothetical protein
MEAADMVGAAPTLVAVAFGLTPFDSVMRTVIVLFASPETSVYVELVAPGIGVPFASHW